MSAVSVGKYSVSGPFFDTNSLDTLEVLVYQRASLD